MKLKKLLDKISKATRIVLFDDKDEIFACVINDNGADSGYALCCIESASHSLQENLDRTPDVINDYKVEYIVPLEFQTVGVQVSW